MHQITVGISQRGTVLNKVGDIFTMENGYNVIIICPTDDTLHGRALHEKSLTIPLPRAPQEPNSATEGFSVPYVIIQTRRFNFQT